MELSTEAASSPSILLSEAENKQGVKAKWALTKKQWLCLVLLATGNLGLAACSSIQGPFFPAEAEKKGTTPSQYGLVFGLYYLTVCIFSPVFGKIMPSVGPDLLRDCGMFVVGVCFILFGFLNRSPPGLTFLSLAYVVRIVEGIASASYRTSNFAIIADKFPNNMASAMGVLETMYGIGLIIGPTLGGVLYEIGGYTLPFVSTGSVVVLIAILSVFTLPATELKQENKSGPSAFRFLLDPLVILYICLLTIASMMLGFNQATLEPHLRQFHLSPTEVGLSFVLAGGAYAVSAFFWGFLIDRNLTPTYLSVVACFVLGVSYTFLGPAPIIPMKCYLSVVGVCLVFLGIGLGATRVIPFLDCLKNGIARGFEDNISTYGMISGIFNSAFGIGYFLGPSAGGLSVEVIGYERSTFIMGILAFIVGVCFISYVVFKSCRKEKKNRCQEDEEVLLHKNSNGLVHNSAGSNRTTSNNNDESVY